MKESLRRAIARRDHQYSIGDGSGRISIPNRYGHPIGKPVCIRSIRRANRRWLKLWRGHNGADTPATVYSKNSSCKVARTARLLKSHINGDI